jgi:N-acetylmuramoyl-L-alanine amidase
MPSVLVEIGFISNAEEELYLMSEIGQYEIAASIFQAICEYKSHKDNVKISVPSIEQLIPNNVLDKDKQMKDAQLLAKQKENERLKQEKEKQKQEEIKRNEENEKGTGIDIVYRVQFASMKSQVSTRDKLFEGLEDVWSYEFDGYWKYCAGLFATQKEASNYVQKVRSLGHKDAFVVVFYNGKRITFEQVRALEKEKS